MKDLDYNEILEESTISALKFWIERSEPQVKESEAILLKESLDSGDYDIAESYGYTVAHDIPMALKEELRDIPGFKFNIFKNLWDSEIKSVSLIDLDKRINFKSHAMKSKTFKDWIIEYLSSNKMFF